jgi:hypothetical protein
MHEELKAKSAGNGDDAVLTQQCEKLSHENNQLHQALITVKEECTEKISQMSLGFRQMEGKLKDAEY